MKISTKSELKALIKECLIEILSEGSAITKPKLRDSVKHSNQAQKNQQLPEGVPSSMKSLFADSQRRAAEKMYQESVQVEKQSEFLGEMAGTWESMTFSGVPLPSRATNPYSHIGQSPPPPSVGNDDYDDDFDPYEAVRSAIPKRR